MWLSSEVDTGYGLLSSCECLGLEDSASAFQPTFMQQRLKWPPCGFDLTLQNGSCEEGDVVTDTNVPDTEFYTRCGGSLSKTNSAATYYGQDSSGTESSVCPLENCPDGCSEMGGTDAGMPPRSNFSRRRSYHSINEVSGMLPEVCLYPEGVMSCMDDAPTCDGVFYDPVHDMKLSVGWMEEDNKGGFIKEECSPHQPPTSHYSAATTCPPNVAFSGSTLQQCHINARPDVHKSTPATLSALPIPARKLTAEQNLIRKAKVARYLEKRKKRTWGHKIRYASRKAYAENRPRIKGRFAKQEEVDALKRQADKTEKM